MLAVKNERESEMGFSIEVEEAELAGDNLLDAIDFDDLLVDGDFEIHHHFFAQEFSAKNIDTQNNSQLPDHYSVSEVGLESSDPIHQPESEPKPPESHVRLINPETTDATKKSSAKKKVKVDWTPELHRRFVEAVEQLGIDKAVPSRILEIMGIDCLTRHNIASHLQKYRSHRKHVQAREAEAASWGRRRQMYVAPREVVNPWTNAAPTLGIPPVTHFRVPLHVWGHPSVDHSLMYTWHKHVAPPPWPPPLADPASFWHPHHQYVPPPGSLFFQPPQFPPTRFPPPPPPAAGVPAVQTLPKPPSDVHPSKESIDAAIGDVIKKPWLPLPLGLKPPSTDGVMAELRRLGVSKIPPTT